MQNIYFFVRENIYVDKNNIFAFFYFRFLVSNLVRSQFFAEFLRYCVLDGGTQLEKVKILINNHSLPRVGIELTTVASHALAQRGENNLTNFPEYRLPQLPHL